MSISQRSLFLQHLAQTSDFPLLLEIDHAKGVWMYGKDRKYLDLISGISVSNVGHCHPKVVKAIQKQSERYMHLMVYGEVVQDIQNECAEAIVETLPSTIDNLYFLNSGSEAIEAAIKLAKKATGRPEIVCCNKAYHGSSAGALSMIGDEDFRQNYTPLLPGIRRITFNDPNSLDQITHRTATVFMETIQGEAGVRTLDPQFVEALKTKLKETGSLLVLDEIQAGFGRSGTFWAFEQFGLQPDMVVMAKGMGGGMPISALASSKDLMQHFASKPILGHITTFGGHPVSCAASLATMRIIQKEGLHLQVPEKSALFVSLLKDLPHVKEVRAKGFMIAVELGSFDLVKKVIDIVLEKGLFTDWFLFCDTALRIAPPLVIEEPEIRWACKVLEEALDSVSKIH